MANAPIQKPKLYQAPGQPWPGQQRLAQTDVAVSTTGSQVAGVPNVFTAQEFVVLSAGALIAFATDGTALYGLALDDYKSLTGEPYTKPFGNSHNVLNPKGARFVMNITDGSGTIGSGSTTQANVAIGTRYAGHSLASPSATVMAVDASDSGTATKNIFQVVSLWSDDASGDFNGRVIVEIIDSAIQ